MTKRKYTGKKPIKFKGRNELIFILKSSYFMKDKEHNEGWHYQINIYQDFTLESIKSHFFTANCDFERRESLITELYKIIFK